MRKVFWLCTTVVATLLGVFAALGVASSRSLRGSRIRATHQARAPTLTRHGSGRLVGAIVFTGDVPRGASKNRHQRGWVEVSEQHDQLVAKQWVNDNHEYHFTLAPGAYDVAG